MHEVSSSRIDSITGPGHQADPPRALPPAGGVFALVEDRCARMPDAPLFEVRTPAGWEPVTASDFRDEVTAVARGLLARGVGPGEKVALMASTSYEWTVLDFAITSAGAVTVPVYETSAADQVEWICADAEVCLAVVASAEQASTIEQLRPRLPGLRGIEVLADGAVTRLRSAGRGVAEHEVAARRAAIGAGEVATIVYTSGTTGRPRGVELSHGSLVQHALNGAAILRELVDPADSRMLHFLPLAHAYARMVQLIAIAGNTVTGHSSDLRGLTATLLEFRPTFLLAVPRVLERVYRAALDTAAAPWRRSVFLAAAETARTYSRVVDRGEKPAFGLAVRHAAADALVYRRVRRALGGRVRHMVIGGAPLAEDVIRFFRGAGFDVLEGYGLTETCAPTTCNRPGRAVVGSVGPAFPGVRLRVAEDGEIEVRGVNVFLGYHNDPEATRSVMADGWLRTGDLGRLDAEGNLYITGRKKELIVTASGKNVAPAPLEDAVRAHPLVAECLVIGDRRPFVAALVSLDRSALDRWLTDRGRDRLLLAQAAADPEVRAALQHAIDDANTLVSRAESIKQFAALPIELTESSGHITPSLKVRRQRVLDDFDEIVTALYAAPAPTGDR